MSQARARGLLRIRLKDLAPETPAIAEPSTGLTMGQSAEKVARENGISREEQDRIAFTSHRNAAAATDDWPAQGRDVPRPLSTTHFFQCFPARRHLVPDMVEGRTAARFPEAGPFAKSQPR